MTGRQGAGRGQPFTGATEMLSSPADVRGRGRTVGRAPKSQTSSYHPAPPSGAWPDLQRLMGKLQSWAGLSWGCGGPWWERGGIPAEPISGTQSTSSISKSRSAHQAPRALLPFYRREKSGPERGRGLWAEFHHRGVGVLTLVDPYMAPLPAPGANTGCPMGVQRKQGPCGHGTLLRASALGPHWAPRAPSQ